MLVERVFTGIIAVVCLWLMFIAWGFVAPIAYDPLGPRPYPILLLSLLILSCVYLTIRPKNLSDVIDLEYNPVILKKVGLTLLFFFIFAFTFEFLGFPIATAIMSFAIGVLFGGTVKASLISGILLGIFCYVLFDILLDVPLPLGFFSS